MKQIGDKVYNLIKLTKEKKDYLGDVFTQIVSAGYTNIMYNQEREEFCVEGNIDPKECFRNFDVLRIMNPETKETVCYYLV